MRCFYLPGAKISRGGGVVDLPDELKRHLQTVLRLQPGEKVQFFDGHGQVATALLKEKSQVEFLEVVNCPVPRCYLTLIQGVPKGDKFELILQKGTELGVNEFHLTPMARSVGRLKPNRNEKRLERWQRIIHQAASQCRQFYLPQLEIDTSLSSTLVAVDADLKLLLWEESSVPLVGVLPPAPPQRVAVIVGPEGGITPAEVEQARGRGYQVVSLGPRILRTETAGLAIMTILQYLYGDLVEPEEMIG